MGGDFLTGRSAIRRLRVVHEIPTSAPRPADVRAAVAASLGEPLRIALDERFRQLEAGDPDALWLVRSLTVGVTLPMSVCDPPQLAAGLAAAVERAVLRSLQLADAADCVRFDTSAAYVAAFVRAALAGADSSWLFDRLSPARGLAPLPTLMVACRLADCDPVAVIAELARGASWTPFVLRLQPAAVQQLRSALRRSRPPATPTRVVRAMLDELVTEQVGGPAVRSRAVIDLVVLGQALAASGDQPGLVHAALASGDPAPDRPTRRAHHLSVPPVADEGAPLGDAEPHRARASFRAAGVASFVLATSIGDVSDDLGLDWLIEDSEQAAATRADMLARVLNVDRDDPAVATCAGVADPGCTVDALHRELLRIAAASTDVPTYDVAWLAVRDPTRPPPDPAMMALAEHLARSFLGRLVGFRSSPLEYVAPRLFGSSGTVTIDAGAISVEIVCPSLLVVLQLAGLADFVTTLPWIEQPVIVHHEVAT